MAEDECLRRVWYEEIMDFPVKTSLFAHQSKGAQMALEKFEKGGRGFAFLFEIGTGKTLTSIAVMGKLYEEGKIERVLVVAPTSVCSVWPKDLAQHADFPFTAAVAQGTASKKIETIVASTQNQKDELLVLCINYESVWRNGIFDKVIEFEPDLIIADESQRIKNHKAKQSKAMHKLGNRARYKLALSGTPVQNNALDLWSQYRFLDQRIYGNSYWEFRDTYAIMGGFENRQVVGYKNLNDLVRKEYSIAYRVKKIECLDLPEQTFETRYIEFDKKTRRMYAELKKKMVLELENGDKITAANVVTKLLRLQQLTGGFLQPDDEAEPRHVNSGKLDALADILEDYVLAAGKKLVVFCRFRSEIKLITDLLKDKGIIYRAIWGDIPQKDRGCFVEDFQTKEDVKVFLAQIDTAGLGITLTAADTCVYYSVNFNYAAYTQSLGRIHRIGQMNKCTYISLIVENSIDEDVMMALAKKENIASQVVDNWRKYFKE